MDSDPWPAIVLALVLLMGVAATTYLEAALRFARRVEVARRWGEQSEEFRSISAVMDEPLRLMRVLSSARGYLLGLIYALALLVGMMLGQAEGVGAGDESSSLVWRLLGQAWPAMLLSLLCAQLTVTLLGDAAPWALASRDPEDALRRGLRLAHLFRALYRPLEILIRIGRRGTQEESARNGVSTEEEIRFLLDASAEEGELEEDEREMIHSIFSLGDTPARQAMVPRTDIVAVDAAASLEDAVRLVLESGHSRLPVYEDTVDHIVGIVHAKDMLEHLIGEDQNPSMRDMIRDALFIPESKKLDEVLREFRGKSVQLAVVVDEFGGTAGLLSVEDIIEEIVGEIRDEYDAAEEVPAVLERGPEGDLVDAGMPMDEVNEELGLGVPEGDYDTLGGYVFGLFGRPPRRGEKVTARGYEYTVERMAGLRLSRIRVRKAPAPSGEAEEARGEEGPEASAL